MVFRQQLLPFISLLRVAAGLRVAFSVQTGSPLVPLQEFGAAGGFVNVSLSLFPLACEGDEVHVGVLTDAHLDARVCEGLAGEVSVDKSQVSSSIRDGMVAGVCVVVRAAVTAESVEPSHVSHSILSCSLDASL